MSQTQALRTIPTKTSQHKLTPNIRVINWKNKILRKTNTHVHTAIILSSPFITLLPPSGGTSAFMAL